MQNCAWLAAATAALARLREREANYEFTPEGVFGYALSLRQERSSGTRVGTVTAKEVAAFFSTEGAPKRASNSIIRTALTCLEKVPPPAAVFQEQKEALNRALAELEAMRDLQAFIAAKETELYVVHVAGDQPQQTAKKGVAENSTRVV